MNVMLGKELNHMLDRSTYFQTLINDVMDNSVSEYWEDAVTEW